MRESALKSCIFVGVPRVRTISVHNLQASHIPPILISFRTATTQTILSLASLREAVEDDVRSGLRKTSKRYALRPRPPHIAMSHTGLMD